MAQPVYCDQPASGVTREQHFSTDLCTGSDSFAVADIPLSPEGDSPLPSTLMDTLAVAYGVLLNRRELRDTLIDQPECSPARSVAMGGATS